jgi:hypothetical protein
MRTEQIIIRIELGQSYAELRGVGGKWGAHAVVQPVTVGEFADEHACSKMLLAVLDKLASELRAEMDERTKPEPAPAPAPAVAPSPVAVAMEPVPVSTTKAPDLAPSIATATVIPSGDVAPQLAGTLPPLASSVVIDTGAAPVSPAAVNSLGHPVT